MTDITTPRSANFIWAGSGVVSATNPLPVTATLSGGIAAFQPTGTASLSVSSSSSRVVLPSADATLLLTNTGTVDAFFALGNESVVATINSTPIKAGQVLGLAVGSATYLAAITASSTTSFSVTTGTGLPVVGFSQISANISNATLAVTQSGVWSIGRTWALASAGDSVAAVQSGTWNITNISGTISLPTGAATAANQTSVIGTKAPGTAATNSQLVGGVYNSSAPAPTTGQQVALQLDSSGRLIVNDLQLSSWTDRSLNITTGGTSQQLMAINTARKNVFIQNPGAATESIFINFTSAATVNTGTTGSSIEIFPGGSYQSSARPETTEAINVIATTTNHRIIAKEM